MEEIYIDLLTRDYVNIRKKKTIEQDGVLYDVTNWRTSYKNSLMGREKVEEEVPDPYRTAILAVWGDKPTREDSIEEIEVIEP